MICEIFDDLLEPHVAELIDMEIKKIHWKYDYQSNRQIGFQPHWHVFCGESEEEVRERQYDYLLPIWDAAAYKLKLKERFDIIGWKRLYMNAHTFGVEPHMHTDDGDFTMMYYPRMDWRNLGHHESVLRNPSVTNACKLGQRKEAPNSRTRAFVRRL